MEGGDDDEESLSADLRGRVIAATEEEVSTREAARRFRIGISTAGSWYRRYREAGEMDPRKEGQPSRSKLDAHEAFILGLIQDAPDITLTEIVERLATERGERAAPSTVFLDRRGITCKKTRRKPSSSSAPMSCADEGIEDFKLLLEEYHRVSPSKAMTQHRCSGGRGRRIRTSAVSSCFGRM